MRILLDTNMLFSAAKSDRAIRELPALLDRPGRRCRADASVVGKARRADLAKAPEAMPVLERVLSWRTLSPRGALVAGDCRCFLLETATLAAPPIYTLHTVCAYRDA